MQVSPPASILGTQAAHQGHSVLYTRTGRLLEEMDVAHKDGSLTKLRGQLVKTKLLIQRIAAWLDTAIPSPQS
ncbi:ATP-binding protein [Pseudoxanthomonas mexicana]